MSSPCRRYGSVRLGIPCDLRVLRGTQVDIPDIDSFISGPTDDVRGRSRQVGVEQEPQSAPLA